MNCPIDQTIMRFCFSEVVLGKHESRYFQCQHCGLIQPQNPESWLQEAYSSAIAATDIGLVSRNISNIRRMEPILSRLCKTDAKILDVGGGYGMLCRGLRDRGFDCYTTDVYCENLFARKFEPTQGFKADALLAFEVFEHVADPLSFVDEQFRKYSPELMIFSTLVYETDEPPPRDWWYYTWDTGQHISIYHPKSIQELARKLNLYTSSFGSGLHLLAKRPISPFDQFLVNTHGRQIGKVYAGMTRFLRRRKSLLPTDYEDAKSQIKLAAKVDKNDL